MQFASKNQYCRQQRQRAEHLIRERRQRLRDRQSFKWKHNPLY